MRVTDVDEAPAGWRRLTKTDSNGGTVYRPEGEKQPDTWAPTYKKKKPEIKFINWTRVPRAIRRVDDG